MLKELSIFLAMIESPSDREKFERLFYQYASEMMQVAYRHVNQYELAEDAVNMAFTTIAQNMNKIGDVDSVQTKGLVLTIAKRKAIDLYRSEKKHWLHRENMEIISETMGKNDEDSEQTLVKCIQSLPDNYKDVLILKYSNGYGNREIAELLGYTVTKVDQLVSRGRKILRKQWESEQKCD